MPRPWSRKRPLARSKGALPVIQPLGSRPMLSSPAVTRSRQRTSPVRSHSVSHAAASGHQVVPKVISIVPAGSAGFFAAFGTLRPISTVISVWSEVIRSWSRSPTRSSAVR